jgi:hypothetical protein
VIEGKVIRIGGHEMKSRLRWGLGLLLGGVAAATCLGAAEQPGGENAQYFAPVAVAPGGAGGLGGYAIGRARDRRTFVLRNRSHAAV